MNATDSADVIPLETEPLVFFRPTLAGTVRPGRVQPVRASVLLEEEPATSLQLDIAGPSPAVRRQDGWSALGPRPAVPPVHPKTVPL